MSGIGGIVALDGRDPGETHIAGVMAPLARRGPDGTRIRADGPAALGCSLLATTPEALVERLPLTDPASGCTITADVRLDNREHLIAALGLSSETRIIGDGELILRAYLEWGEQCPEHLLGDFAFAIWDPRAARLFCARDPVGMRQLLYCHLPGRLFLFATEVEAVLAHPETPRRINEARIADFLDNLEGHDLVSTFFEDIVRLPPACSLTVDRDGARQRRYWQLTPGPPLLLDSEAAYAEAFLEVFTEAVACRLRSAGPVGSLLSGGIDSNAVSAIAAKLLASDGRGPLHSFSGVGPDAAQCPETEAIHAAVAAPGFAATLIDHSSPIAADEALAEMALCASEPFDAHMALHRLLYREAQRAGIKVMLDGVGGDVVLAGGNAVAELLREGRFRAALREANGYRAATRPALAIAREMLASGWAALAPARLRAAKRRLAAWREDRRLLSGKDRVSAAFARRIGLTKRRQRTRDHAGDGLPFGLAYRMLCLTHPHLVVGRERYDRVASGFGIEPRDPFLDLRVIGFCLSLPASQLRSAGFRKAVLRRAMSGLLPEQLAWRRGKEHLGWAFTQALLPRLAQRCAQLDPRLVEPFAEPAALRQAPAPRTSVDSEHWFTLCTLHVWLSKNKQD